MYTTGSQLPHGSHRTALYRGSMDSWGIGGRESKHVSELSVLIGERPDHSKLRVYVVQTPPEKLDRLRH